MFTVKKKPLTPNIIWDGSAGRPLCSFGHRGLLETNDPELAEKLAAMGHMVTGEADAPAQQGQSDGTSDTAPFQDSIGDAAGNAETDAGQQTEQTKEAETADSPAQQTAASSTKGRRNGK